VLTYLLKPLSLWMWSIGHQRTVSTSSDPVLLLLEKKNFDSKPKGEGGGRSLSLFRQIHL